MFIAKKPFFTLFWSQTKPDIFEQFSFEMLIPIKRTKALAPRQKNEMTSAWRALYFHVRAMVLGLLELVDFNFVKSSCTFSVGTLCK